MVRQCTIISTVVRIASQACVLYINKSKGAARPRAPTRTRLDSASRDRTPQDKSQTMCDASKGLQKGTDAHGSAGGIDSILCTCTWPFLLRRMHAFSPASKLREPRELCVRKAHRRARDGVLCLPSERKGSRHLSTCVDAFMRKLICL